MGEPLVASSMSVGSSSVFADYFFSNMRLWFALDWNGNTSTRFACSFSKTVNLHQNLSGDGHAKGRLGNSNCVLGGGFPGWDTLLPTSPPLTLDWPSLEVCCLITAWMCFVCLEFSDKNHSGHVGSGSRGIKKDAEMVHFCKSFLTFPFSVFVVRLMAGGLWKICTNYL